MLFFMVFSKDYICDLSRGIIFSTLEIGKVSLSLSPTTVAARLLLVFLSMLQSQPWVQGFRWCQLTFCAGGWNEVLGWCGCSGDKSSNLPACTWQCSHWYLAMVEMLWESCSQGHNNKIESKDTMNHGKPLAQCVFEFTEYMEHFSSAGERYFANRKHIPSCMKPWNTVLGVICF